MSENLLALDRIFGQKQRATMAYRLQANGTTERMVQALTLATKLYVVLVDLKDWDVYAERLNISDQYDTRCCTRK